MTRQNPMLWLALLASLLLHGLPLVAESLSDALAKLPKQRTAAQPPALRANLQPLPSPAPPLRLEQATGKPHPRPPAQTKQLIANPRASQQKQAHTNWTQEVRRQWQERDRQGLFYPPEAIARGLEGTAQVLLIIDEQGMVAAARLETSSGHPLLDQAALNAVRALRSLPASAPRETILPVRFRLR